MYEDDNSTMSVANVTAFLCWLIFLVWAAYCASKQRDCRVLNFLAALTVSPLYIISFYVAEFAPSPSV